MRRTAGNDVIEMDDKQARTYVSCPALESALGRKNGVKPGSTRSGPSTKTRQFPATFLG